MSAFINALPGAAVQGIIWGIMAIGVYITFRVLDIADLTVDGTFSTGGAVMVVMTINGCNIWLSLLCSVLAGCIAGFITGMFHISFGIPAILAGILTQQMLYSINLRIMSGRSNTALNYRNFNLILSSSNIPKAIIVSIIFLLVLVAILYWFFGTEFGASIRATGCNIAMSRANGINTNRNKVIGLTISNGIVALSGALWSQYQGAADIGNGRGAIVIGLAAVIIGEVLFGKIFRNFALTLIAVGIGGVVYYIVQTLVIQLGMNANDLKLFSALLVAFFLGVPYWKNQLGLKNTRRKAGKSEKQEVKSHA